MCHRKSRCLYLCMCLPLPCPVFLLMFVFCVIGGGGVLVCLLAGLVSWLDC